MSGEKSGHPLVVGILIGCFFGFGLGWWFPPPSAVNMPKVKEESKKTVAVGARKAKEKLADASVGLARKLREGETNNEEADDVELQVNAEDGDSRLQQELRATDKLLDQLANEPRPPAAAAAGNE